MTEQYFEASYLIHFLNKDEFEAFKNELMIGGGLSYFGPEVVTFEDKNEHFPIFDMVSINFLAPVKGDIKKYEKNKPFTASLHYGGVKYTTFDENTGVYRDSIPLNTETTNELRSYIPKMLKEFKEKGICDAKMLYETSFKLDDLEAEIKDIEEENDLGDK